MKIKIIKQKFTNREKEEAILMMKAIERRRQAKDSALWAKREIIAYTPKFEKTKKLHRCVGLWNFVNLVKQLKA